MPPEPGAVAGAAEAVTALYEAHALGLIRLAVVMLGDRPAAEDVVQEAFYGLYRRWHALSDTANALAYVRSSVINGCRTALRRRTASAAAWPSGERRIDAGMQLLPTAATDLNLILPVDSPDSGPASGRRLRLDAWRGCGA